MKRPLLLQICTFAALFTVPAAVAYGAAPQASPNGAANSNAPAAQGSPADASAGNSQSSSASGNPAPADQTEPRPVQGAPQAPRGDNSPESRPAAATRAPAATRTSGATSSSKKSATIPKKSAVATAKSSGSGSTATSGPGKSSQGCDGSHHSNTGHGANTSGAYDNTCDGSRSGNGTGGGAAKGKPCAGCVGNADDKNPKGQSPNGTDRNAGYECDRNQGIGKTNPAHTGCKVATAQGCPPGQVMVNGTCGTTKVKDCPPGQVIISGACTEKKVKVKDQKITVTGGRDKQGCPAHVMGADATANDDCTEAVAGVSATPRCPLGTTMSDLRCGKQAVAGAAAAPAAGEQLEGRPALLSVAGKKLPFTGASLSLLLLLAAVSGATGVRLHHSYRRD